ncbi:glycosyltransferase family 4 protein [Chitinophaga eiseniae]|uniref:Glycosyltransferase family 4 protein n=1 Tax=Chitinophaga eiseniae TaxID=634771 RepID=A0A847SMK5_9BACT|nr:glycosyltransferase family 4 protein [Chitinophaga eiseniae]NLR78606.1 glycosyltransferase family 4 protein [Chitinophaga eiseniae]
MARILIHSLIFKPDGVSTAYLYADLVGELKKHGHKICVLTTTPHFNIVQEQIAQQPLRKRWGGLFYESIFLDDIKVYHIRMKKSKRMLIRVIDFVWFHMFALLMGCCIGKYDIVLSPSPPLTIGVISYLLGKIKGAKAIYNVQEIYPDFAIKQGAIKNKRIISLLHSIERSIYNNSAAVVTIDTKFEEIVAPRIKDSSKLHVIPNFVDTNLYVPLPRVNAFSTIHGLDDKFVVGYAGNIGHAQDWQPIIAAAKALRDLPIRFLIVGDGVKKDWVKTQIEEHHLQNVLLLDYQPREMMPVINASMDIHTIVMSPSSSKEGFPSKIYTIMSSAKSAIVVTEASSPLGDLMRKSEYGKLVSPGDTEAYIKSIAEASQQKEWLIADGEKGREFILKNFSKEAIGEKYNNLVTGLLN